MDECKPLHHGTRAVRTHLDGTNSPEKELRDHIYDVYDRMQAKYDALAGPQQYSHLTQV